jgi:nicotinamide-nucleotide amidase
MNGKHNQFIKFLSERNIKLALAESMTCGLAAHQLATSIGTSEVLMGSVVCYREEAKIQLLEVKNSLIRKYSCESDEVTKAMVQGLRKKIKADVYLAVTGLASDGGSETKGKPVGTTFFCMFYKGKFYPEKKIFRGSPLEIRKKACEWIYKMIKRNINK